MKLSIIVLAVCLACASCIQLPTADSRRSGPFVLDAGQPLEPASNSPWFCHDLDCPVFKVLKKTDVYELRAYEPGVWAYTEVSSLLYSSAVTTGFKRLFNYFETDNAEQVKINMTTPVVTAVKPAHEHFERSNYTVNFFLPHKYHKAAPKPKAEDVGIVSTKARKAFVLQFGGFLVDDLTLASHAEKLKVALLEDGHKPVEVPYFTASYDPPTRLTGRHNEIMMLAEDE